MAFRLGGFLGLLTTAEIVNLPVEQRKEGNFVFDTNFQELRAYGIPAEAYPSVVMSSSASSLTWINPVINFYDPTPFLPPGPAPGDRYISAATANGWIIHHVYTWNGLVWENYTPVEGSTCEVNVLDQFYTFTGTLWVPLPIFLAISLNQAYNAGGIPGAGRVITANAGAVEINNAVANPTVALALSRTNGTGFAQSIQAGAANGAINIDAATNPVTVGGGLINLNVQANLPGGPVFAFGVDVIANDIAVPTGNLDVLAGYHFSRSFASGSGMGSAGIWSQILGVNDALSACIGGLFQFNYQLNHPATYFTGLMVEADSVVLTSFASAMGLFVKMPDDINNIGVPVYGVYSLMPASYSGTEMVAGIFTGDGRSVRLCDTNFAMNVVGDVRITGDVVVKGTFFSTESETVLIADNHLYLNNGYTLNVAQTGGLVVNYLPTVLTDTVNGPFVPGVPAVSNPTVITTGAAIYALGDLIQISGTNKDENTGLFEVLSHVANVLTIRGIGLVGTVEDFTQNQFVTDTVPIGDIVKVNVSVIRSGTDGLWEDGRGNSTPIVFADIAHAPGGFVSLDQAYDAGGAGLGRSIIVDAGAVVMNNAVIDATNALEVTKSSPLGYSIYSTGRNYISGNLDIVQIDSLVSAQGALDITKTQTIDLNNIVRGQNYTTIFSAINLGAARNLQGFFNTIQFTGNLTGTNKCSIIGMVNTITVANSSGRVGSGDSLGLFAAANTFKSTYAPPALNTGFVTGWTNIQSQYLHNGDSNGTTSSVLGIDQGFVFGGGTKYTIINATGILVSATFGAGSVGSIVTNLYMARLSAAVIGAGITVTNNYGLRIETATGGVNNWSLFVAGGLSYFGGNIQSLGTMDMTGGANMWFRPPSMTTAQRNAMSAAWGAGDAGKTIYNTTTNQWEGWNGGAWSILG